MRRLLVCLSFTAFSLALAGCSGGGSDDASEWLHVLKRKQVALSPAATSNDKQIYADTLASFVQRNPSHGRAREVYERVQLDFAMELASLGRHQDAIRFYRAVLAQDPNNPAAARGLAEAVDHLAVSRQKLLALQKGMSQKDVARLLGKPIPGWVVKNEQRDVESWYYRKTDGGVAGAYFRNGQLFAAEENSHAKLAPIR